MMLKTKFLMIMTLLIGINLQARTISIKNDMQFFDEINTYEFALVCFLDTSSAGHHEEDKKLRKKIKLLEKTIDSVSDTQPYRHELKREVGFLIVDITKESVKPLVEKYHVIMNEIPQFLLFHNGKVISDISGEVIKIVGFIEKADLLKFISDHVGKKLDLILEKKEEDKQEEQEMQIARYAAYVASRYPYNGYAPYNANGPYSWYGYSTFYQNRGYWGNEFFLP